MAKESIKVALQLNNGQFDKALSSSTQKVQNFEKGGVASFTKVAAAIGTVVAAAKSLEGIVAVGSTFEDLQNSLNVVFGSVQEGAVAFERIKEFAKTTQFSVEDLTKGFIQLKGAGVEPTNELMSTFANTASITIDQLGSFQAMLDLVSRTTAGGLNLQDLNRLGDRAIPVFDILEKKLGKSRKELTKMGQTAEGAKEIIDALTEGLNERFGTALESGANNISRLTNNLGDSFNELQAALFELFSDELKNSIKGFTTVIEDLTKAVSNLDKEGRNLITGLGAIAGIVVALINPFAKLRVAFGGVKKGAEKLAKPIRTNAGDLLKQEKASNKLKDALFGLGAGLLTFFGIQKAVEPIIEKQNQKLEENADNLKVVTERVKEFVVATTETHPELDLTLTKLEFLRKKLAGVSRDDFGTKFKEQILLATRSTENFEDFLTFLREFFAGKETIGDIEEFADLFDRLKDAFGISPFDDFIASIEGLSLTTEDYNIKLKELNALIQKYPELAEEAAEAQKLLDEALSDNEGLNNFLETLGRAQKTLSEDLVTAFREGESAGDVFKQFFNTLINQIIADVIRLRIIQPILGAFLSPFGFKFGTGGNIVKAKALGGPVMKNKPYIVGERGPELFVPNSSGDIVPNNQLGGSSTTVNYNIQAVDAPSFQALVARDPEFIYNVTTRGARKVM